MKQIVLINNDLKMSKGKIARVCLMLGYKSAQKLGFWKNLRWQNSGQRAIVLKADEAFMLGQEMILHLENRKYVTHIDAGLTQVPAGSVCGISFFVEDDDIDYDHLKLY